MKFTNVVPTSVADTIDDYVVVAYDMATSSTSFANITDRVQLDDCEVVTANWSVTSDNSGDVLSVVPSFTSSGNAIRLTLAWTEQICYNLQG